MRRITTRTPNSAAARAGGSHCAETVARNPPPSGADSSISASPVSPAYSTAEAEMRLRMVPCA
ncbi:MAG TPA: hypothetical protein VKT82_01065 [Ktedonobacterales bacterium]|nr:hypothetical protein [Ktedonobacterales bacterium]